MKYRPAFPWLGGKSRLASWIISKLPPHRIYVEPFGGAMSVLLNKPPSQIEVYNDIDEGLVHFWRVVRDPELFPQLQLRVLLTPYARAEHRWASRTWSETNDPVERAARWYTMMSMAFGGRAVSPAWGFAVSVSSRGMSGAVSGWLSRIEHLPEIHSRLQRVQIEHGDWREIIDRYDTPETLFYCDPPYILEARRCNGYAHEMTVEDHRELVDRLLRLKGAAALSGYRHAVYEPLEQAGWTLYERNVPCQVAARTRSSGITGEGATWKHNQRRVECLWVSPHHQGG